MSPSRNDIVLNCPGCRKPITINDILNNPELEPIHGVRKLEGDYLFALLGASTPLSQTAWNTMGKVGSRLLFLNAPSKQGREGRIKQAEAILKGEVDYRRKKMIVKEVLKEYVSKLFSAYDYEGYEIPDDVPQHLISKEEIFEHCGYYPRVIEWQRKNDDEYSIEKIAFLAEFLTACRSDAKTWTEQSEGGGTEINSTGVVEEGVDRFTSIIYNLARGHAILTGRNYITDDDLSLVVMVVLSSIPDDRRKAIELLIDTNKESPKGEFTITELMRTASCSDKTAKQQMYKLGILGIGKFENGIGSKPAKFILDPDYSWLTSPDFRRFYRPWD